VTALYRSTAQVRRERLLCQRWVGRSARGEPSFRFLNCPVHDRGQCVRKHQRLRHCSRGWRTLAAQSWACGTVGAAAREETRFGRGLRTSAHGAEDLYIALRESKQSFENERTSARASAREAEAVALASCTCADILLGPGDKYLYCTIAL
jgi:hypothetical protein